MLESQRFSARDCNTAAKAPPTRRKFKCLDSSHLQKHVLFTDLRFAAICMASPGLSPDSGRPSMQAKATVWSDADGYAPDANAFSRPVPAGFSGLRHSENPQESVAPRASTFPSSDMGIAVMHHTLCLFVLIGLKPGRTEPPGAWQLLRVLFKTAALSRSAELETISRHEGVLRKRRCLNVEPLLTPVRDHPSDRPNNGGQLPVYHWLRTNNSWTSRAARSPARWIDAASVARCLSVASSPVSIAAYASIT